MRRICLSESQRARRPSREPRTCCWRARGDTSTTPSKSISPVRPPSELWARPPLPRRNPRSTSASARRSAMLKNDPYVGSPRSRVDGPAKVTGAAKYAAEFTAPDLAFGYVVSSAVARGRIAQIDIAAAQAVPGVLKVFTHENRPRTAWFNSSYQDEVAPPGTPFRPLYDERIHYSGQPIALVVAETFEVARYAALLIRADYEAEPHETHLKLARARAYVPPKKRSGITPPPKPEGDAMKAYSEAPVRVYGEFTIAREHHNPMEPHASTVMWDGGGKLTVYDKIQGVQNSQGYIASVFGLSKDDVRVLSPFVGGGFGSGLRPQYQLFLAVMAALDLERSVRVELTRDQMFSFVHRPATITSVMLGANPDGRLVALKHDAVQGTSQFEDYQEVVVNWSGLLYHPENVELTYKIAKLDTYTPGHARTGRAARYVCDRERDGRARLCDRHRPGPASAQELHGARREREQGVHVQGAARLLPARCGALRLVEAHAGAA